MELELGVCSNFRPYAQALRTLQLGCVNCGYPTFKHANVCDACSGTGRKTTDTGFDDNANCEKCSGSGRLDGMWSGV
jgi:DnaJ-class molecular chaperone